LNVAAAKMPPVLPRETSASALPSLTSSAARAMEESFFFTKRAGRFVVHLDDFAGVDHAHAMVAETAFGQRGMDISLVANEV